MRKSLLSPQITFFYLSIFHFFQKIDSFLQNFINQKPTQKETKNISLAKQKLVDDEYLNQLNDTEVYVIVSSPKKKKRNKLLLIQTQERLSGSKFLHPLRFAHILFKGRQKKFFPKNWFNKKPMKFTGVLE